jgi:hypothetical protein
VTRILFIELTGVNMKTPTIKGIAIYSMNIGARGEKRSRPALCKGQDIPQKALA